MNSLPRKALLLLLSISAGGTAVAGDSSEAREWLARMTTAMSELSYQGTFVYVRGGEVETMRITHVSDDSGVRERLYSISGPRSEVIRDRKGVRFVLQDSGSDVEDSVVVGSYFTGFPLSAIGNNSEDYRLELRGKARIAGQTTRRVSILPQDNYRYGYDFWLEEKTGLLLQWVLRDSGHKALAKLMFTDFSMGPAVDVDELESESPAEDFVELRTFSPAKTVGSPSSPGWHPHNLPPGFKLTSHSHKNSPDGTFEHMVYSDGLAAVSVYIENKSNEIGVMQGVGQLGTNYAFSRKQGDLQITAIGEVPAITVKTIANSMARSVASN